MVRRPDALLPVGAVAVRGDLTIPESLDTCLDGVTVVFLVWTAPCEAVAPAMERITRQARRIVFLSAPLKTPHPFFQQPNPLRETLEEIERAIEASQLEWTLIRPGMFAGNALHFWGPQIRAGGSVRWPYLDTPTAPIDERDVAAVVVRALCDGGHAGREYVITGPQSLTQREQIQTIAPKLRTEEIGPEEAQREFRLPGFLLDAWRAGAGRPAFVSGVVAEIMGKPPRTFAEWAADHAEEFRA
jgi:uncharacterized protein YbjT (DUF2867 family)